MKKFAENLLTFLEREEEKLLSWGFYQVQCDEADMLLRLQNDAPQALRDQWSQLQSQGVSFKAVLREMRQSQLLFRLPGTHDMYRSRMAEGIRLLANLRQMFSPQDWATGPRLVSDIKLHLRDRVYPRRDLPAAAVWSEGLAGLCSEGTARFVEDCFEALARDVHGHRLYFSGFQRRSFECIFREYYSESFSASVVCAGTGSGKTKAFYMPAFLRVAEEVSRQHVPFTKVVAVYPRNVLLADQLREALSEAEKLRPILEELGCRTITLGALLGDTPRASYFRPHAQRQKYHWRELGGGHVIPYLKSPVDGRSDLIWRQSDRLAGRTSLYRVGETTPDVPDGMLRITREQLMDDPPDILFLSLEMLNREMGNPQWRRTLGIRQGARSPRLVLLDEVHTHEGIAGAQAAWVLRRWKYWMHFGGKARPCHFVGLSATLKEACEHMARICGLYPEQVTEFAPKPGVGPNGEMEAEGQEYNLAIKGDPSSGTSLLSTSIQTGMLLARIMTPRNRVGPASTSAIQPDSLFLSKVFGFTDNLDSLNRWFANMRDAERQRLARLRLAPTPLPGLPILRRMRDEGQIWELPGAIGHDLDQPLDISRCSSQDPGADVNSDLILATSSLEVGFDDPQVGLILHHKAPMSMASFIQRKGRAGRPRRSRPWTAVTLSDYGRDRWAFQSAERLFCPEVGRIRLPIANPYVLRVQMALFLIDWLGNEVGESDSPFAYLRGPSEWEPTVKARRKAQACLMDFLEQGARWQRFYQHALQFYLHGRTGLSWRSEEDKATAASELNDIFWEQPRPLLTAGIPELLRKLEVGWKQAGEGNRPVEDAGSGRPMPKWIPKATFEELDLDDARVELQPFGGRVKEDELLPMARFLQEACPARVSKRFSTLLVGGRPEPGYWHEYSPSVRSGTNAVPVGRLYPECASLGTIGGVRVYRPLVATLIHTPEDVLDSSSSQWQWRTVADTREQANGETLVLTGARPWDEVFSVATAHLHINGTWVDILRHSTECRFEIRRQGGGGVRGILELRSEGEVPESVGFQVSADGLRFGLAVPHLHSLLPVDAEIVQQFRYEFFLHLLRTAPALRDRLNVFSADWMAQVSTALLCATAVRNRVPLHEAQKRLEGNRGAAARRVLETIFQLRGVDLRGEQAEPRLKQELLALWDEPDVVREIALLEPALWRTPPGHGFDEWVRQRYSATLAQALRVAAAAVSDQVSEEDLVVDVIDGHEGPEVLLTEKSSGGLGQIESVVQEIRAAPRFFLDALEHALMTCPRASWAESLSAVAGTVHRDHVTGSGALGTAFSAVRNAVTMSALQDSRDELATALHERGINPGRATVSAISMKLLRPGSSSSTDSLTYLLNESWRRHSRRLGLQIPVRTFAYVASSYPPSHRRLMDLFRQEYTDTPTSAQLYAIVQQLLFDGCQDSCPDCLDTPNHFNDFGKPARNLALFWLALGVSEVAVGVEGEWMQTARRILTAEGRVCLVCQAISQRGFINQLVPLFFEELSVQGYREPVYISQVERTTGCVRVTLQIRNFTDA